jgi:hypothetical protein
MSSFSLVVSSSATSVMVNLNLVISSVVFIGIAIESVKVVMLSFK